MAYARTSAGPAGRPGACISPIGGKTSISRHFFFGNRSLVDFTERNRRPWGLQGHAFCAWTAMDPSGYFLFEKHSLIDFQIGKGRKRDFPRGRAAIFSTQRILRGRDPILSIQRIFKRDRCDRKMAILQAGNSVCRGYTVWASMV